MTVCIRSTLLAPWEQSVSQTCSPQILHLYCIYNYNHGTKFIKWQTARKHHTPITSIMGNSFKTRYLKTGNNQLHKMIFDVTSYLVEYKIQSQHSVKLIQKVHLYVIRSKDLIIQGFITKAHYCICWPQFCAQGSHLRTDLHVNQICIKDLWHKVLCCCFNHLSLSNIPSQNSVA